MLLKGLPLLQGISPSSAALIGGTITSPDLAQTVHTSVERLRSETLPDVGAAYGLYWLNAVSVNLKLSRLAALFPWLDGIAGTLEASIR